MNQWYDDQNNFLSFAQSEPLRGSDLYRPVGYTNRKHNCPD